jgi:integrase
MTLDRDRWFPYPHRELFITHRKTGVRIAEGTRHARQGITRGRERHRNYFFISGEATPKGAVSTFDKQYRKAFTKAGIKPDGQLSHTLRHTFAVELLKAGVDVRKVSRALGHSSVVITEKYYAKWNRAQQDILDGDLASAWST